MCLFPGQIVPSRAQSPHRRGGSRRVGRGLPTFVRAQNAQNAQSLIQLGMGDGQKFDPALVLDIARQLARRPFMPVASDLPDVFMNQPRAVCSHQGTPLPQIWADGRGISVDRCTGVRVQQPVGLHLVEDGLVRRVPYERVRFDYGRLSVPANLPDLRFSGFKLLSTFGNGQPVEFATVQGATFFRAVARGQTYGAVARALTLKPAETRGEEFPVFQRSGSSDLRPGRTL